MSIPKTLIAAAVSFLLVSGGSPAQAAGVLPASQLRKPNNYEVFYQEAALIFNEPDFCRRISPQASLKAGFNPKGYQISLVRSACLNNVAGKYGRGELCDEVEPVSTTFLDGKRLNPQECRQSISRGGSNISTYSNSDAELIAIFKEMGYTPQTIRNALPRASSAGSAENLSDYEAAQILREFFLAVEFGQGVSLSFQKDFLDRVKQLPDFGGR